MPWRLPALVMLASTSLVASLVGSAAAEPDLRSTLLSNAPAYIPPQCYTRTQDALGKAHNPCATCHLGSVEPNYINDGDLQLSYDFPGPATVNHWTNLFRDRRAEIAAMSDALTLAYVRTDNYGADRPEPILADRLAWPPAGWDFDGDGTWSGWIPDVRFAFDAGGFDHAPDGTPTGWRAYAYAPLPGAFWPTNGSADDVAIRLPAAFRERADGTYDPAVYGLNLAIVEALVKQKDVPIPPTDEAALGVDLDRDGKLATADHVAFAFDPRHGVIMDYVGRAKGERLAAGLFPVGTEFVHTVRYLDVGADGAVQAAPRLKELRYAVKRSWRTYSELRDGALGEIKEAYDYPDRLRRAFGDVEHGVANGQGWIYQGFIEDAAGDLRPQTFEESVTCVGCHSGIGRTADSAFSYPRKLDAPAWRDGWYHWSARGMGQMADPRLANGTGEYRLYLPRNGAGDEFRANTQIQSRFFDADGQPIPARLDELATTIANLVMPTPERALALDKAYRLIVQEQSFTAGRTADLEPLDATIHREVKAGQPTGISEPVD